MYSLEKPSLLGGPISASVLVSSAKQAQLSMQQLQQRAANIPPMVSPPSSVLHLPTRYAPLARPRDWARLGARARAQTRSPSAQLPHHVSPGQLSFARKNKKINAWIKSSESTWSEVFWISEKCCVIAEWFRVLFFFKTNSRGHITEQLKPSNNLHAEMLLWMGSTNHEALMPGHSQIAYKIIDYLNDGGSLVFIFTTYLAVKWKGRLAQILAQCLPQYFICMKWGRFQLNVRNKYSNVLTRASSPLSVLLYDWALGSDCLFKTRHQSSYHLQHLWNRQEC